MPMIGTCTFTMTIGEIVAADYRTAAVFRRHGIDFCCHGARTLERGCRDAGIDTVEMLHELQEVTSEPAAGVPRFNSWDLSTLVSYIVTNHHGYVREMLPVIVEHWRKIAEVHGSRHRELPRVAQLVDDIADEMTSHMVKEEQVLFSLTSLHWLPLPQRGGRHRPHRSARSTTRSR